MSIKKITGLLLPVSITPLFYYLVWNNYLEFGAGEKDLIFPVAWGFWSIVFAIFGMFISSKNLSTIKWLLLSFSASIVGVVSLLLIISWLFARL